MTSTVTKVEVYHAYGSSAVDVVQKKVNARLSELHKGYVAVDLEVQTHVDADADLHVMMIIKHVAEKKY